LVDIRPYTKAVMNEKIVLFKYSEVTFFSVEIYKLDLRYKYLIQANISSRYYPGV